MSVPSIDLGRARSPHKQVITRRETFGAPGTCELPRFRQQNSLNNMDATQKKINRPSNLNALLQDFQRMRSDIKNMQSSHQRIVDKIRSSYEPTKTTHIISQPPTDTMIQQQIPFSRTDTFPRQKSPVNKLTTNYRFEVEQVQQLKGFDQAYQIKSLENALKQLNRRLEEETSSNKQYQFQVWLLRDILNKHGIHVADDGRYHQVTEKTARLDISVLLAIQKELQKQVQTVQLKFEEQMAKLIQRVGNLNTKINKIPRSADSQQKDKIINSLKQSHDQKSKQLQAFREQVSSLIQQVNSESLKKVTMCQQQITQKQKQIWQLRQTLRKKTADSPRKKDEATQLKQEVSRLTRLVVQMNVELEMKDERLAENQVKLIEMKAQVEHMEMKNIKISRELQEIKKLEWPTLPPTRMDHSLDESQSGVDRQIQCTIGDQTVVDVLKSRITGLEFQLSMLKLMPMQSMNAHSSEFENKNDVSDRKMYKSVLNVALVDKSKDSRLSRDSKIPRSKGLVSLLRDEQNNRKSQNNFSKVTGYKELSLNLSVDEDGGKQVLDIEEMIRMPEYPFESLKLSHGDTVYLLMKMAQIIRCHRDQLKQKQRLLHLLRRRLDTSKDFLAERESTVLTSNIMEEPFELSDFAERYSQRRDKAVRRPCQWQTLQRQSMQAIQRLLSQIQSLQAQIEKSQKNQINLIQMKEIYKAQIQKLKKQNEYYATYYKQEVGRLNEMIEKQQEGTNMEAIRSLVWEVIETTEGKKPASENHKEYIRLLKELLSLPGDIS